MEMPPTVLPGFFSRKQVTARYAERTGFDLSDIEFYRSFQYWKVAILAEGVKRRYETGTMANTDVDFDHLNQRVVDLTHLADEHLQLVVDARPS
jgi:aminoglycoside phosphotransferase (APT) family kinase protein